MDRSGSEWIRAIFGIRLEWIGACFVSGVEWIGAWIVSGSEWIGAISVECVELGSLLGLGVDRSLAASSCERIGVWVGVVKA